MNLEKLRTWNNSKAGILARLMFSLVILAILFWKVDFSGVVSAFMHISLVLFSIAFAIHLLVRLIQSYQIAFGLAAMKIYIGIIKLLKITFISDFYSLSLPGRGVTGSAILWLGISYSKGSALKVGTLLLYVRLMGVIVLLGLGFSGIMMDRAYAFDVFTISFTTLFALAIATFVLVLSPRYVHYIKYAVLLLLKPFSNESWFYRNSRKVYHAIKELGNLPWHTVVLIMLFSLCIHISGSFTFYLLARALDIDISFASMVWIRSFLILISIAPITIADLGVREVTLLVILDKYGISGESALSLSFAIFMVMILEALIGWGVEKWGMVKKPKVS